MDLGRASLAISARGPEYSALLGDIALARRHSREETGISPKLLFEPGSSDLRRRMNYLLSPSPPWANVGLEDEREGM
jgi:hypothetical protein